MDTSVEADRAPSEGQQKARPPRASMAVLTVLLVLLAVAMILSALADVGRIDVINRLLGADGQRTALLRDLASAHHSDDQVTAARAARDLVTVGMGVAFIVWLYRAYRNVERLTPYLARYRPRWVIGACIVPICNLFQPKQIVDETWRMSEPAEPTAAPDAGARVPTFLHIWWAAALTSSICVGLCRVISRGTSLGHLRTATWFDLVGSIAGTLAAALATIVVDQITKRQGLRAEGRELAA